MMMDIRQPAETQRILTSTSWHVSQPYYDFLQSITFEVDGTGEMVYGYAQAVRLLVRFRYTLPQQGRLHLEFLDTVDDFYGPMFTASEQNRIRDTVFILEGGGHASVVQTMGGPLTQLYRYALHFDTEPFPEGYQPEEVRLTYYGSPLRAR
jgi:hypothetical protein